MKLCYLGTAAAEGFPALYCGCEFCENARRLGGKNLRTRSQALVNEDLLLDYPSDTYAHFLYSGQRLNRVKRVLVTHSHEDHFTPTDLIFHGLAFAHNVAEPRVTVYGNEAVKGKFDQIAGTMYEVIRKTYDFVVVRPYETFQADGYEITPLPARHMSTETALVYLIKEGDKTLLYAHDTGIFFEEVFEYLREQKIYLNALSLDCTMVSNPIPDDATHMGVAGNVKVVEKLRENGTIDENTALYANHFSHNGNPTDERLKALLSPYGITPAYDGMTVEI